MDRKTYNELMKALKEFIKKCSEINKKIEPSPFGLVCIISHPQVGSKDSYEIKSLMLGDPVSCGVIVNVAITDFKKNLEDIPPKDRHEIIKAIKEVDIEEIKKQK